MKTLASVLAYTSLLVGCLDGDNLQPDPDDPSQQDPADPQEPAFLPRSCGELADRAPSSPDGEYTLYVDGDQAKPWKAYCHDFQGNTTTYLVLAAVGPDENFSGYAAGNFSSGTDVRTRYTRVKFNAFALTVDINDQRFASSSGTAFHTQDPNKAITSMPYGVAAVCGAGASIANIDLTGTPFAVKDTFVTKGGTVTGIAPDGGVFPSPDNKVLDIFADGACATTAPASAPDDPFNTNASGAVLQLAYVK